MARVENRFRIDQHTGEVVWLELLEGPKTGMVLGVPARSPHYSEPLQQSVDDLEESDTIAAELVSENERNTAWRFETLEREDRDDRTTTPVTD